RINRIRRENPALQHMRNVTLHEIDNDHMIAFSKQHEDNLILTVVNLDPYNTQSGWLHLPLDELGIPDNHAYQVHDLLGGEHYYWHGAHSFIQLNPHVLPAHILRVQRSERTERDFPYFA